MSSHPFQFSRWPFSRWLSSLWQAVRHPKKRGLSIGLSVLSLAALAIAWNGSHSAPVTSTTRVPAPALDQPASAQTTGATQETAVLAGGCFWGVEGVFEHVAGVKDVVSGFSGGSAKTAHYGAVSFGQTGHAEAVKITYDPTQISYGQLLQIYFAIAHDPTQVNRQGPDVGTQYRSAIFFANPEQQRVAQAYIDQLNQARVFDKAIATQVVPLDAFYAAEDYHQDFITHNPSYPYVVVHDLPKIEQLRTQFANRYQPQALSALKP